MKSPRDILLQRHQATEPRLDIVRQKALDKLPQPERTRTGRAVTWLTTLQDLVRLPRLAWGVFGTIWLAIVALNIASSDRLETANQPLAKGRQSPDTLQALRDQRRLLAELVDPSLDGLEAPTPSRPRPRSARKPDIAFA